jgi:hypothetical protein
MTDIEQKALALVNEEAGYDYIHARDMANKSYEIEALCRAIEQHEATKQKAADTEQQLIDAMQSGIARAEAQHEAFKQKVSDALVWYFDSKESCVSYALRDFIIIPAPKPDPLVEVLKESDEEFALEWDYAPQAKAIRAALEARGLEIRSKSDEG